MLVSYRSLRNDSFPVGANLGSRQEDSQMGESSDLDGGWRTCFPAPTKELQSCRNGVFGRMAERVGG